MIPLLDAAVSLGGLVIPPLFDFIKKKFIKAESDTPERTMGTLATTNPGVLPEYVKGLSEHIKARVEWFNRDVLGKPSQWIIDLRAAIRPITVGVAILHITAAVFWGYQIPEGIRLFEEAIIGSWFGSRLVSH